MGSEEKARADSFSALCLTEKEIRHAKRYGTSRTMPILALELDRDGHLSKKTMKLAREEQLTNTLLEGFCPGIRVATVDVPTEPLDACEQAIVEQALTRVRVRRNSLQPGWGQRQREERKVLRGRISGTRNGSPKGFDFRRRRP